MTATEPIVDTNDPATDLPSGKIVALSLIHI